MTVKKVESIATPESLLPGVDLSAEEFAATDAVKERWWSVQKNFLQSHRFLEFIKNNYVVVDEIDAEAKQINTLLVENPTSVGPPLSSGQLMEIQTLINLSGCKKPDKVFNKILKILGQDAPTLILTSS